MWPWGPKIQPLIDSLSRHWHDENHRAECLKQFAKYRRRAVPKLVQTLRSYECEGINMVCCADAAAQMLIALSRMTEARPLVVRHLKAAAQTDTGHAEFKVSPAYLLKQIGA